MPSGNIFIVRPANTEQELALKAFVKALKIKFVVTNQENYKPEFVAKINESKEQYSKGEFTVIKTEDLWK